MWIAKHSLLAKRQTLTPGHDVTQLCVSSKLKPWSNTHHTHIDLIIKEEPLTLIEYSPISVQYKMRSKVLSVAVIQIHLWANSRWIVMFPLYDVSQVKTSKWKPQMTGGESGAATVSRSELHHWGTGNSLSLLYASFLTITNNSA